MVTKAYIAVHREDDDEEINVVFNPTEYDYKQNARYTDVKALGQNGSPVNYTGTDNAELSFSLTIDGFAMSGDYENPKDVTSETKKLRSLTAADPKLHAPPRCTFVWGSFSFYGIVSSVSVKYTMFTGEGMPVRATVNLTMKEQPGAAEGKAFPKESPDRTKRRVLKKDTQLFHLAWENYADVEAWRHIARANNIKNPRRPEAGTELIIPALTDTEH